MSCALAIMDKRRTEVNEAEIMHVIGDVEGRTAIVVDDMIDTAGTLVKTVDALFAHGAQSVYACCTHPVLSGKAVPRICQSKIEQVVVTNSIPISEEARNCGRIKVLSVAPLLARAIQSIHEETSVSTLFI
jgi:ribose-phosphate pyrophosphokinase